MVTVPEFIEKLDAGDFSIPCKIIAIGKLLMDFHCLVPLETVRQKIWFILFLANYVICPTVQTLNERMPGHPNNFYRVLSNKNVDETRDDFSLGFHLINEHSSVEREDFHRHLRVQILKNCRPSTLEKYPLGLNKNYPFKLAIIT